MARDQDLLGALLFPRHTGDYSVCCADPAAGYKDLPGLVAKLKETFHAHAAESAAKQQPTATVREANPEAVAPAAAQSLHGDAPQQRRSPAPDPEDDPLREGMIIHCKMLWQSPKGDADSHTRSAF